MSSPLARLDPLPFRLRMPGSDTLDFDGARSVSYRLEGVLHVVDRTLTLEWTGTKRTQLVTFGEVKDDVGHYPVEWLDVPVSLIADARVRGGWWAPRLELRARRPDVFDGMPIRRTGSITLRIRRRDRELAREVVRTITRTVTAFDQAAVADEGDRR